MINRRCQLCQRLGPLQNSHLLPASLYAIVRKHSGEPVVIQDGVAVQTSQQMKAHLLCSDCEQTLNKNGENWVLRNCYRGNGVFPLAKLLRDEFTQGHPLSNAIYTLTPDTAVRVDRLAYFGVSVLWRAAVQSWPWLRGGTPVRLSLGPYTERFRRFLLGEQPFPHGVCLFVLLNKDITDATSTFYAPQELQRGDTYRKYQFLIPGLFFQAILGSQIPHELRTISTKPGGNVLVTPGKDWEQAMLETVLGAKAKGSLRHPTTPKGKAAESAGSTNGRRV